MDTTNIEFEPLSHQHAVPPSGTTRPRTRAGWVAIGLAVVATGMLGVLVARNDSQRSPSADRPVAEQVVAIRPAAADPIVAFAVERYRACLPVGAGSADAMERQELSCRRELEQTLFPPDRFDPCIPQGAGSADGMERWVQDCREVAISALLARSAVD